MQFSLAPVLCLTILGSLVVLGQASSAERKPNVVFILADDVGVNDLALYGSKFIETPNIDCLAERGIKFTQAYSASPLCSPTRASILSGLFPARIGITAPDCHLVKSVLDKHLVNTPCHRKLNNLLSVFVVNHFMNQHMPKIVDAIQSQREDYNWGIIIQPKCSPIELRFKKMYHKQNSDPILSKQGRNSA